MFDGSQALPYSLQGLNGVAVEALKGFGALASVCAVDVASWLLHAAHDPEPAVLRVPDYVLRPAAMLVA